MLNDQKRQPSIYSILYNKIPDNHILKIIHDQVDFSFINGLFEESYCKYYGRPAKEPELTVKILLLKHYSNLSDKVKLPSVGVFLY